MCGTLLLAPIIVMIWNVVFANKSQKLGCIWMKLGRWGWGLRRLSLAHFQQKRAMGFRHSMKNGSQRRCFCHVSHTPFLPLSLDRFPPNFTRTHVQVVARETWFHIPEKFPLRDRISRKTLFFRLPYLWSAYGRDGGITRLCARIILRIIGDLPHNWANPA